MTALVAVESHLGQQEAEEGMEEDFDYGLGAVAAYLGKQEALEIYREGGDLEASGKVEAGIVKYRLAFKKWRELDSVVTDGGLPRDVRKQLDREMDARGDQVTIPGMISVIDVDLANSAPVVKSEAFWTESDLEEVDRACAKILETSTALENNPQNRVHTGKTCLMLSNNRVMDDCSPFVCKLRKFAAEAWDQFSGPLAAIKGGQGSLNIRVIEAWTYEVGGGLTDPSHYDNNSVLTFVTALTDQGDFEGGVFRTKAEEGDGWTEHPLYRGDIICFVSHKTHTVTPVTKGTRRSLVIELWEGPVNHDGRGD